MAKGFRGMPGMGMGGNVGNLMAQAQKMQRDIEAAQAELKLMRIDGTSGGGQVMSLCVYIKHENINVPLPGKLVLQSPGLQVPPSGSQRVEMEKRILEVTLIK